VTAISEVLYQGPLITKALILLHGRGGTARSILGLADRVCDNDFYIAAPQAIHKTWYPYSFMEKEERNEPHLSLSIKEVKDLYVFNIKRTITKINRFYTVRI
jgi:phospholipase/carboxylesterase